jgi:hypothetical protein
MIFIPKVPYVASRTSIHDIAEEILVGPTIDWRTIPCVCSFDFLTDKEKNAVASRLGRAEQLLGTSGGAEQGMNLDFLTHYVLNC